MNVPETINIEKYAEALNNLIGIDSAYMAGDKDVDAIVEVIVAAKKLEIKVKELTEENERLKSTQVVKHIHIDEQFYRECEYEMGQIKIDTVRKMQQRLHEMVWRDGDTLVVAIKHIDQVAKEILEERNGM